MKWACILCYLTYQLSTHVLCQSEKILQVSEIISIIVFTTGDEIVAKMR